MCRWKGVKIVALRLAHDFGLEIFFLYRETNVLEIKFCVKNMLVTSFSVAVINYKIR